MSERAVSTLLQDESIIDFESFEIIYNSYWEKLYSICYSNIEDPEIAKDLVQDIFISLWERRKTIIINDSLEKYLVRSAKFKVFEYIRNKVSQESKIQSISYSQTDSVISADNLVEYNELSYKINESIASLPQHCQKVFYKSRIEGKKNKEIAQSLHITERTVEYHITKALTYLRANLKEYATFFSLF